MIIDEIDITEQTPQVEDQKLIPEIIEIDEKDEVDKVSKRDPTYFHYYSLLVHQQNMLQDAVRTSSYQSAILQNKEMFEGKLAMDVGAGSGILSFFAVQAGAKVIAVEASNMALKLQKLVDAAYLPPPECKNPWLKDMIKVINSKIEDVQLDAKVDVIVSEPIGVVLVHERMLESFLYARDHFLKPGGAMVPSQASLYLAPICDAPLWVETMSKVRFWESQSFYGVDLTPLRDDSNEEAFSMPVIGYFDPNTLMCSPKMGGHLFDFNTITMEELKNFQVPIRWKFRYTGVMHGIGSWFDLYFLAPPSVKNRMDVMMSTGPSSERTHWQQARFLLKEPLAVNAGQIVTGFIHFMVNAQRSYDLTCSISLFANEDSTETVATRTAKWYLHEQSYNYSYLGPTLNSDMKPENNGLYETSRNFDNEA